MERNTPDWREAAAAEYSERRLVLARTRERALARAKAYTARASKADAEIMELDRGAKVFGLAIPEDAQISLGLDDRTGSGPEAGRQKHSQFKDIALEYLAKAYPAPRKALDVQQHVEAELSRTFHWKTAGMTLYRLKKEGLVERQGQNWYYLDPLSDEGKRAREHARMDVVFGSNVASDDDLEDMLS